MFKYIKQWFMEGWNEGKARFYTIEAPEQHEHDEIALLEIIIERRKDAAAILENELATATGKRKIVIINQLNNMDKQTYRDMQRINKLKDG